MKKGYDRIAHFYDRLTRLVFGKSILLSQTLFFDKLQFCNKVLVVGGGTGQWLNNLIKKFPHLKITFVDSSLEMIRLAKKKLELNQNVNFIHGTIESVSVNEKFDAVALFYFLDLFSEGELLIVLKSISGRMKSGSTWLVSDFVNQKKWHAILLWIMYLFFNVFTGLKTKQLPDWQSSLNKITLRQIRQKGFFNNFIQATIYQSE